MKKRGRGEKGEVETKSQNLMEADQLGLLEASSEGEENLKKTY